MARVETLSCPIGRDRVYVYDVRTPALAICVTETGAKVWYLYRRVNGRSERIRLGRFPELGVQTARKLAEGKNADIVKGVNTQDMERSARDEMTL